MSEATFRAVVAAVLVGALVVAAIAVLSLLPRPPAPNPTPVPVATATPTPRPTPTPIPPPTPTPGPAFTVEVTSVGDVPQGWTSARALVLRFAEPSVDAIPDGAGSLTVTLADAAGAGETLAFAGTPALDAPGSLGASAELRAPNVLVISIVASDSFNVEPITLTGLGIGASPEAALGPIRATLGGFEGSLAGGVANVVLPSPGVVVAGP